MKIMSYLTGTAIALAATIGSVSAADQFTTLEGVAAEMMTSQELGDVTGSLAIIVSHGSLPANPASRVSPNATPITDEHTIGAPDPSGPVTAGFDPTPVDVLLLP